MRDLFDDFRQSLDRAAWFHIITAVLISVLIMSIIMVTTTASKGAYDTQIQTLTEQAAAAAADRARLRADLTDNTDELTTAQNSLGNLATRMNANDARVDAIEGDVATLMSPPEVYLTGTFGNYTAHVKVDEAGNYTINIYLDYLVPVSLGNVTNYGEAIDAFYASINWTATDLRDYAPTITYSGNTTSWGLVEVAFNTGTHTLAADTETAIPIAFGGLNYTADFAYAEIWKVVE
jgi:hypothetical protein